MHPEPSPSFWRDPDNFLRLPHGCVIGYCFDVGIGFLRPYGGQWLAIRQPFDVFLVAVAQLVGSATGPDAADVFDTSPETIYWLARHIAHARHRHALAAEAARHASLAGPTLH